MNGVKKREVRLQRIALFHDGLVDFIFSFYGRIHGRRILQFV